MPLLVNWPQDAFTPDRTNLVIGIIGPDPFDGLLEKLTAGQRVGGHPISVHQSLGTTNTGPCHILFVPAGRIAEWKQWRAVAGDAGPAGVLTIGEDPEFLSAGGIIRLESDRRTFELHLANAVAQGDKLRLDPKLKRSAARLIR